MPTDTSLSTPTLTSNAISRSMTPATSCASSSSLTSFVCGAAAGAAAGVALALLFTPMRGPAMRARVRSYAAEGGGKLQDLMASGRNMAQDYLHQATSAIEEGRRAFRTSRYSEPTSAYSSPEPLTASVAEISGGTRRFEEPLGG